MRFRTFTLVLLQRLSWSFEWTLPIEEMRQSLNCLGIEYVQFQRFAQKRAGDELVAQSPQEQLECADRVEYETGENGSQNIWILTLEMSVNKIV